MSLNVSQRRLTIKERLEKDICRIANVRKIFSLLRRPKIAALVVEKGKDFLIAFGTKNKL